MPPEVILQNKNSIDMGHTILARSLEECTKLLTQSIDMLTVLQEDPTLRKLEAEAWELQHTYDQLRGTV